MTYDLIIIGAGTAGLTAAIYARRAKKSVLVLEGKTYGGQIVNTSRIDNYPAAAHISGPDFAKALYEQAESFDTEFEFSEVLEIKNFDDHKEVITEDETYQCKTIILATGSTDRRLGLPSEDDLVGHGISYCATCDGHFFKDEDVAIDGGGNTALWSTLYLADLAKNVYLIHRRQGFRADDYLVDRVKSLENVHFILDTTIKKLNAKDGQLDSLTLSNGEDLKVKGLFVSIGRVPQNDFVKGLVDLDDQGYIITNEACETNVAGIFAAGDCRVKQVRQLVTATGDGAIAATGAINYLNS